MTAALAQTAAALPWFLPAAAFLIGACVGSFLNVVILRVPAGESVVRPRSHCACGAPIAWHDNIPIASWFMRGGRARCCGRPFSIRYPAVELLTALLFLACWLGHAPAPALCGWIFLGGLVAATFIDVDHLMIPDAFTLGLGIAGVLLSFLVPELHGQRSGLFALDSLRSGAESIEGLLLGSGLVLWIALFAGAALRKEAMGLGDVKFAGAIGAFCGWKGAVFALFGGAVIGTAWLAAALAWRSAFRTKDGASERAPLAFGSRVPFGPMLAVAGALYFLLLHREVDAWFARFALLF